MQGGVTNASPSLALGWAGLRSRWLLKVSKAARLGRLVVRRRGRAGGCILLRLKSCFLQLHVSVNIRGEIRSFCEYHVFAGAQGKNRSARTALTRAFLVRADRRL